MDIGIDLYNDFVFVFFQTVAACSRVHMSVWRDIDTDCMKRYGMDVTEAPIYNMSDTKLSLEESTSSADANQWLHVLTLIIKTSLMALIILASVFGNLLVILSVFRFRKLRIITNYFLVSLALADILVALVAMGFNASVIIFGRWMFGYRMCDVWNSFDVYFCTVSILHLCCISVDRYYAISQPLMYPMKITSKKVAIMLTNIWIWPGIISFVPIFLGWYTTEEHLLYRQKHPDRCQFVVNKVYAVISSSVSFWIPCTIMLYTYYRIYKMASRQEKMLQKNSDAAMLFRQQNQRRSAEMEQHQLHHQMQQVAENQTLIDNTALAIQITAVARQPDILPAVNLNYNQANEKTCLTKSLADNATPTQIHSASSPQRHFDTRPETGKKCSVSDHSSLLVDVPIDHDTHSTPTKDKTLQKLKREHKAARTLGIIMGAFVLCWLPFFIWYLSIMLCGDACYCPDIVVEVLFWIGYFNSTLNPLIYAYFHKDFREAFRNTLICVFCGCSNPPANNASYMNVRRPSIALNSEGRTRHSIADTVAGVDRIDHKRFSVCAVQKL